MAWKQVSNADVGDADHVGGNDWDKLMQAFSGSDVDDFDIACDFTVRDDKFKLRDSDNSNSYIFSTGNLSADRTINIPVLTGSATLPFLELSNVFTVRQEIRLSAGNDEFLTLYKNAIETGINNIISWEGQDSAGNNTAYVQEYMNVNTNTNGAEEGAWALDMLDAGVNKNFVWFDPSGYYFLNPAVASAFGELVFDNITVDRNFRFPDADGDIPLLQTVNDWSANNNFSDRLTLQNTLHAWYQSPTALASNTNNYLPTNWDERTVFRLSSSTNVDITGFDDFDDKIVQLFNIGSNTITLKENSSSSLIENRMYLGGNDIVLAPNHGVTMYYDGGTNVYRPLDAGTARIAQNNLFSEVQTIKKDTATLLTLYRPTNSVSFGPELSFNANDSAGNETQYARLRSEISVNTDGAESGYLRISAMEAGTLTETLRVNGSGNIDMGPNLRLRLAQTGLTAQRTFTFKDATYQVAGVNLDNVFSSVQTISSSAGGTNTDSLTLYKPVNTVNNTWELNFDANDSGSAQSPYAAIRTEIITNTAGSEDGQITLRTTNAGTEQSSLTVTSSGKLRCGGANTRIELDDANCTSRRVFKFPDIGVVAGQEARVKVLTHDYFEQADEFFCSQISDTATSNIIGTLGWITISPVGTGAPANVASSGSHPGIIALVTSAASGDNDVLSLGPNANSSMIDADDLERVAWIIRIPSSPGITTMSARIGIGQDLASTTFGTAGAWFQFDSAVNAAWQTITREASTSTTNTSGTTVTAGNWYLLEIVRTSGGNFEFYINNSLAFTHSANQPTTNVNFGCMVQTATTAARNLDIDYFHMRTKKLGQRWT